MGVYVQFLFLFNHGIETANRITGQVAHGTAFIKDKDHFHMGWFYFLRRFFFRRSSLPEKSAADNAVIANNFFIVPPYVSKRNLSPTPLHPSRKFLFL